MARVSSSYSERFIHMSENAVTSAEIAAVTKKASKAASAVTEALPSVVETTEIALEVPAKVVFNQKLVVTAAVVGGAALGAGIFWGVNKWRTRNRIEIPIPNRVDDEDVAA